MAIVTYTRVGTELTREELAMLAEAKKFPPVYDEDSPKLTPAELAEFHPVNGMTWEERSKERVRIPASPEECKRVEERVKEYHENPNSFIPWREVRS